MSPAGLNAPKRSCPLRKSVALCERNRISLLPDVMTSIIMVFTLDLLMRAFFGRGELFVCHSSLCRLSRDRSRTPMIHLLLLLYAKNLAQFRIFSANPDKFPTGSLFAPQTSFSAPILHKCFACANVLLEFYEPHFYSSPFLLQSS